MRREAGRGALSVASVAFSLSHDTLRPVLSTASTQRGHHPAPPVVLLLLSIPLPTPHVPFYRYHQTSHRPTHTPHLRKHTRRTTYLTNPNLRTHPKCDPKVSSNVPSGRGEYHFANGDTYDGEWVAGAIHGRGTYTSKAGGWKYVGGFDQGVRNGQGYMVWQNGARRDGVWCAGAMVRVTAAGGKEPSIFVERRTGSSEAQ